MPVGLKRRQDVTTNDQDTLQKCGLKLNADVGSPLLVNMELLSFRQKLVSELRKENIRMPFITAFETHIELENSLKSLLLPISIESAEAICNCHETLLRLLLNIDSVQLEVATALLEKAAELSMDAMTNNASGSITITRLILQQFRWLTRLSHSLAVIVKLFEILGIVPVEFQREIISVLPEICDDKSFKVTIEELKRLLGDHRELTVVILDTFSNLDLDPTLLDDVRNAVMQTFDAANIGDLPVIIKFILQTTTVDTIQNVVMQFRKRLTLFSEDSTATRNAKSQQNTEMSMIIEALKSAFSYRRHIADGFLKVIDNDTESCVFDVVVCIVLHSIDAFKRNSVILFKKKIKAGIFNVQLISSCLKLPVRHYFTGSVLNLSDLFLRSNHSNLMKIASRMYIELFTGMNDSYHQQEFVGSLISHVGSGITAEADEAIYVLLHLTEVSPATCQALSSFVVMLKSLLDVMDTMNISQIRNLITLFCRLTVANQNKDALMKDDLNMIVRKQMSGHQYKYKWMGIVTAVTLAHHLSITTSSSPLPRDLTDHIHQLLEMVLQCCKLPIYLSLFYNELSYCLKQSKSKNTTIVEWVNDTIVSDFQDRFLSELAEVDAIQKSHLMFNIEKEDETTIYIKVYPLITSECIEDRQSLLYFVSQFKLFQTTEKNYNYGSLKNIDGLLGCPLLLHPRMVVETDTFKSLDSAQLAIYVACIVHSYNWISELLNAFASQSDEEIQCRVLSRLTHLIHLKQMLETAFPCMELNSVCMNNLPVMNMSIQSDVGPCSSKIPIKNFQQFCEIYLNDLEMDVFHIFKYKDLSLGLAKPDTNSLKLNELLFILTNLNVKLEQSLPSCASQIKPNATKSELQVTDVVVMVNFIVDILPNLCRFLEDINKALFENSESNEIETDETRIMINIIEVLFNIFYVLLNWTGFESIENEALFEKCLIKLSFRMFSSATSSSTMNIEHHFKHLYEYFKSFTNSDTEIFNRHRSYLIAFIRLLSHLSIKSKHVPYQHDISSLCEAHLKKQNVYSSSNISNQFIPFVLQNYLLLSNDIKSLETVVIHIMCELLDSSVNQSKEHPLLTRGTFHLYYKVCIYVLIEYMKKLDLSHTAMTENATILNLFIYVSVLQSLVIMVKTFDHRSIMGNVMRGSRQFIDLFLKIAMPYVDSRLRDNKEDVMLLLRNLQSSTRSLQNICNHTKVIKEVKLTSYVPPLKRALESLVFRVKVMLENNQCRQAFWFGNLKHRNLQGEEISSQAIAPDESEDNESDTEVGDTTTELSASPAPIDTSEESFSLAISDPEDE